jgi:glucose/arabinose dehydrogenase
MGRPAALAVARDGALLVADNTGGTIWRIAYMGARPRAGAD